MYVHWMNLPYSHDQTQEHHHKVLDVDQEGFCHLLVH